MKTLSSSLSFAAVCPLAAVLLSGCADQHKLREPVAVNTAAVERALSGAPASGGQALPPSTPWLQVNDQVLTIGDLNQQIQRMLGGIAGRVSPKQLQAEAPRIRAAAEQALVQRTLLLQEAQKRNFQAPLSRVQEEMDKLQSSLPPGESLEGLLQKAGRDKTGWMQDLRRDLTVDELQKDLVKDVPPPSEEEVQRYYDEHPEDFRQPEARRVRHLLRRFPPGMDAAAQQKLVDELEEVRKGLLAGMDFTEVIKQQSEHPDREAGGVSVIYRGQFPAAFEAMVFALEPETYSEVIVEPGQGAHLLQVLETIEAKTLPITTVRGQLETALHQQQRRKVLEGVLRRLADEATIRPLLSESPSPTPAAP